MGLLFYDNSIITTASNSQIEIDLFQSLWDEEVVGSIALQENTIIEVNSQGNDISDGCSAVIATADYKYLKLFKGSSAGLNGNLDPGNYIAVVKLNQQSFMPTFPVQVVFTVNEGQECLIEAD